MSSSMMNSHLVATSGLMPSYGWDHGNYESVKLDLFCSRTQVWGRMQLLSEIGLLKRSPHLTIAHVFRLFFGDIDATVSYLAIKKEGCHLCLPC